MIRTNCNKCIFADFTDSDNACAINIIDQIKDTKTLTKDNDNFYIIENYRCAYGFNLDVYKDKQSEIGSIENLKQQLAGRAQISYYMIVFLDDTKLESVCDTILSLPVLPKFVSFITYNNNNTKNIIETCTNKIGGNTGWKLHNMLEVLDYQNSLDVVLDTNTHTKSSSYLWINSCDSLSSWQKDMQKINHAITVLQPECNALFREPASTDGLFIGLKNYDEIRHAINPDILKGLEAIPNPIIKYYA